MNENTARTIARAVGYEPFEYSGYYQHSREAKASQLMQGRSHYYDADTRRYFKSRVLRIRVHCSGLVLGVIESCAGDFDNSFRIYRPVFHVVDGHCIERSGITESASDSRGAEKLYSAALARMDDMTIASDILARAESKAQRALLGIKNARKAMRAVCKA